MKTRSHIVALAIAALALSPHLARGQSLLIPEQILRIKAANLVCNAANDGKLYRAIDQSAADDCDTTGGGAVSALCLCDESAFVPLMTTATDLAAYVPVTKAGQQSITATGAGNDVTVNSADKIVLAATGQILGTGTYGVFRDSNNTGISFNDDSVDQVRLYADDDASSANTALELDGDGGGTVELSQSGDFGYIQFLTSGESADIFINPGGTGSTAQINPGGGAVEVTVAAGSTTVLGSLILPIATAPPAACAAGTKGTIYYDSDINKLCVCNATNYVLVDDATTTTGCS